MGGAVNRLIRIHSYHQFLAARALARQSPGPMAEGVRQVLSARLRERRARAGLSQAELASRAGLSTEFVSRVERGATLPSLPTLMRVCAVLGCTPDDLLLEEATPQNLRALQYRMASASPELAARVLWVADAVLAYGVEPKAARPRR